MVSRRFRFALRPQLLGLPVALLWSSALGAEAAPPDSTASIHAGVEWGNTDSHRLDAGAVFRYREATQLSVSVARADAELLEDQAISTFATAKAVHDFGNFGVGLGVRRGEVEDVSSTRGWFGSAFFDYRQLRVNVEVESRESALARTPFTEDFGPSIGMVSGTSHCDVASMGYHAQLNLDRPRWSLYAAAHAFDYADYDCELSDLVAGANMPPGRARGIARRLAAGALAPVSGFASRLIPREATLLDSSVSLGAMMPINDRWYGGLELYRDMEKVGDSKFSTALGFAGLRLNATWSTEFTLGYTSVDVIEDTAFAGLRVTANL